MEIDFDYLEEAEQHPAPEYDDKYGTADTISTNSPNFSFLLANFGQNIFRPPAQEDHEEAMAGESDAAQDLAMRIFKQAALYAPDKDIEARIEKYVGLLVRFVRKLRRLSLFITAPFGSDVEEDTAAWTGLLQLEQLEELEIRYARYKGTDFGDFLP